MKILFLHGWHSAPGAVKPTYLAQHGHAVINPQLADEDFEEAVRIAQIEFDKHQPIVVVGESRGGTVAMNIDSGDARLVLLCPGWKKWGTVKTVKPDTVILHARTDDIVRFTDSEELVRNSGLPASTMIEVGHDNRLNDSNSLEMMLKACIVDDEDEPVQEEEDVIERDWTGLCYTAALRWARGAEDRDWSVVHGTVWSDTHGKRIEHAWCEREGVVVDLALPVGLQIVERERYYRSAQPEVSKVYSSEDALLLAIRNRHDGPWDKSEQLRK
jgi:hypothetical protein